MPPRRITTDTILAAARTICLNEGVAALTMRRLGEHLDVSAPALYRHYPNKPALLRDLVDEANGIFSQYLVAALSAPTPLAKLTRTTRRYFDFARDQPVYYELLFFSRERVDIRGPRRQARSQNFQFLLERVREAMAAGALTRRDVTAVAFSLWGLMHGLVALERQGRFAQAPAAFTKTCTSAIGHLLTGLLRPPSTSR